MSSKSPAGSPDDEVECEFLVSNIRPSTPKDAFYSYFSCYGQVMDGKHLLVNPFNLKNNHSVLNFTRAFVVKMNLTNEMKGHILRHQHIINDLIVSVKEYKGELHHMEELNGYNFKYHFLLQSFTDMRHESHVIRLLENHFNGMNCRFRLLDYDVDEGDEDEGDKRDENEEKRDEVLGDCYFDQKDPLTFKGDAVISFFSNEEFRMAREIAKRCFPGCRISKWDPKQEKSNFEVLAAQNGV